jgi:cytochrome c-type biogenesis protein CcmE
VTDRAKAVIVRYRGVLPDLFREGQGVVVQGAFEADHSFTATTVLAKHDENYMPKELAEELKKQGLWQHDKSQPATK